MKKTYTKPRVAIENFVLTQNIPVSSGYKDEDFLGWPTQGEKGQCGWNNGIGEVFWTSVEAGCSDSYSSDLDIGEVCYNSPAGVATIFAS